MRLQLLFVALTAIAVAACSPSDPSPTPTFSSYVTKTPPTSAPSPTSNNLQPHGGASQSPTSAPPSPTSTPTPVAKPNVGVQGQFIDPRYGDATVAWAADLGVGWIKQQVDWNTIEVAPDEYRWDEMDHFVDQAELYGLKILLSVARAPGFSRSEPVEEDGPPNDFALFNRFMLALSSRYRGRVAAYELWNEPNLRREWRGHELSAEKFVAFIQGGASWVRQGDPAAIIISGAPGPTGIDDKVNAIDDRVYLQAMITAGVGDWVDAIGAHSYAAANPPDDRFADATHHAAGYNNHPSFFFLDTIEDYHAILTEAGIDKPIWITEFGWPSIDSFGEVQTPGWDYAREVSEADQAAYLVRAIQLRRERVWLGPMFVWNLNVAWLFGPERPESAYGLIRPDGSLRPAYERLRNSGE